MPEVLEMKLSESFEKRDEEPAVECVARFININYGNNKELLNSCKRLHDYSYFVACVREHLKKGFGQKEAVVRAVDECIEKGILEDVLVKHRAEVEDMFLTTFDKKMYEEAIREEGREELAEKCEELARKADEEKARADEEKARADEEKARADEERARADNMEVELARLREENARLKGEKTQ